MINNDAYELWVKKAIDDKDITTELENIAENENEIYERFYKDLEFGTAGLRGIIGAGTNRMNIYTVRRTTQGFANYLNSKYSSSSVAISYDSRIKSQTFAEETASVFAANGITVYISKKLQPTPVLSFAVREHSCNAGVMITASHNPAEYNGYKCYGFDGCQLTDIDANEVYEFIQKVDIFKDVKTMDFNKAIKNNKILYIKDSIYEKYLDCVKSQQINPETCKNTDLSVVYTPLNGAGNILVREILKRIGVKKVFVVKEQELPDGNFSTCPYPNPEFKEALLLALNLAKKENPDIVLATDPDSDRVGVAVKDDEDYKLLTGNEIGILLVNYIFSCKKENNTLPSNPVLIKTIVSSEMAAVIAKKYGAKVINVLTGFKYIGEQILNLEKSKEESRYTFGFEESFGYLSGTYVRDKDAVSTSMLICEMTAYYKKQNKNLLQVLNKLYSLYGYYSSKSISFGFEGSSGMEKMENIMSSLRENPIDKIGAMKVIKTDDYLTSVSKDNNNNKSSKINLPKSNVIMYTLSSLSTVIIRPSGTEPKIKLYMTSVSEDFNETKKILKQIEDFMSFKLKA